MNTKAFSDLGLAEPILRALHSKNYVTPTPIQARAIPQLLDGRDMLGIAQTGTGKTAAFALPILQQLAEHRGGKKRGPRALILAPTRELAIQIGEECRAYGKHLRLRQTVIYGGVSQRTQVNALAGGVDLVIATPGRLLDLMNQRRAHLGEVAFFVLDEADRMLDMGFIRDIRKIMATLPAKRQSLLFSATMPKEIDTLSSDLLDNPVKIEVTPRATPIERIEQRVYHVVAARKTEMLTTVLEDPALDRVIVFTRTKHRANRVAQQLVNAGVDAEAIHGDKAQGARQRALSMFRNGKVRVLVATDIAARGIDVDAVSHVINYELPNESESYVHRIGRTARAGANGAALAFCDPSERGYLRDIERLIQQKLVVVGEEPVAMPGERERNKPRRNAGGKPFRKAGAKSWNKSGSNDGPKGPRTGGKPGRPARKQGGKPGGPGRYRVRSGAGDGGGRKRAA